jgi:hypothetical protein
MKASSRAYVERMLSDKKSIRQLIVGVSGREDNTIRTSDGDSEAEEIQSKGVRSKDTFPHRAE